MGLGGDLQLDDAVLPTPSNILHASIHGRQQLWRIETPKVCSATGRTPQINTVVDPIRWYRLTVVVCSQRTGWKEQPPGRTVKTTVRLGHSDPTHQAAQKGQTSHPPNPSAPRRALSRARAF